MKMLVTAILLVTGTAAGADVLYSQPALNGGADLYASQNDTGGTFGNYATASDDFTLGGSATITGVSFSGGYYNGLPGGVTAFTVTFSSDSAGTPGSALYTTTIPGNAGESLTGSLSSYFAPVNFAASSGTKYWLSIVADLGFPPQWGWSSGTGGDDASYQVFFGSGGVVDNDFAFTLEGGAVPEPASWALMIGGFGLVGATLRRRRQALPA